MDIDVVIIGGGVIGLACAAQTAKGGLSTLLVERHESFGHETSSRNSEVIHSGMYYTPGSLKARLCVAGNASMYAECERLGVWHQRCGKLVVAVTEEESPEIEKIYQRGLTNGVQGLRLLTSAEAKELEPNIHCYRALHVPSTGIVDSHELMKAYMHEAKSFGAECVFHTTFNSAEKISDGYRLGFSDSTGSTMEITSRYVINAAGLSAGKIASAFGIDIKQAGYTIYPNRGHYYKVSASKSKMVSRLIYPVPFQHLTGLGVHITIDRGGQIKLGPDAEYVNGSMAEKDWYAFDDSRAEKFFESVSRYFPALERTDLSPDQVGVRPKVQAPGEPVKDFIIAEESNRGLPGLVTLIGIESPGLTCSHEIARKALKLLQV